MFPFTKILLPVDFSARSADLVRTAAALAERFGAKPTLLHVLSPEFPSHLAHSQASSLHDVSLSARQDAEGKLEELAASELHHGSVDRVLLEGDVAANIVDYARSENFDLIMMPTHGHGLFRRLLLGSITAKVLHDANCPVWTAVHTAATASGSHSAAIRRIACAIDLGPDASRLLYWAKRISEAFGAALSTIHVVVSLDPRLEEFYLSSEWRGYLIGRARSRLADLQAASGVEAESHIEIGPVPHAVADAAREAQADLLIIGRGQEGLTGRLAGNAYAIIRESPCPVLSV
jgi:nucleotide-binding universal stress UspA family protein